jgi:hypothetical protein
MRLDSLTLVIPSKADVEREAVAQAWSDGGGRVERLDRFWEPPAHVDREGVRLYGNDTFCLVVAQKLDLRLVSPDERILAAVPDFLLRRRVRIVDLGALERVVFPVFVKPVVPKQFRAAVYASKADLESECHGLGQETAVVVSEVVRFEAEARAFALDSVIRTLAVYEGAANHDHAAYFAERVLRALDLPRTCVLDVGLLDDGSWAFIEANATWGAGLNGCDPMAVAVCIAAATEAV